MKKSYYFVNDKFVIMSEFVFNKIKRFIKRATVSFHGSFVLLKHDCHRQSNYYTEYFMNGKVVPKKQQCQNCSFRFLSSTGNCKDKEFIPVDASQNDFRYLENLFAKYHFVSDSVLLSIFEEDYEEDLTKTQFYVLLVLSPFLIAGFNTVEFLKKPFQFLHHSFFGKGVR